jgi:alpha-tubulin suppressor-like RCC1 family protein
VSCPSTMPLSSADFACAFSSPDLPSPHLLRSLRTHRISSIHTSSHSSHTVAIDTHGIAYLWGRAASSALGLPGVTAVWEESPLKIRPVDLGLPDGVMFTSAATGRAHTLLVASDGSVWSAGLNSSGQVCSSSRFRQTDH